MPHQKGRNLRGGTNDRGGFAEETEETKSERKKRLDKNERK